MDVNGILGVLLGVGGAGGITGFVAVYRTIRQGRIADEETIISRQSKELARLERRVNEAQDHEERMRRQRNAVLDQAAFFRRMLVALGAEDIPPLEDYRYEDRGSSPRTTENSSE
jgi:hypothetical protein